MPARTACHYFASQEVKDLWPTWTEQQRRDWIDNWGAHPDQFIKPVPLAWMKPITDNANHESQQEELRHWLSIARYCPNLNPAQARRNFLRLLGKYPPSAEGVPGLRASGRGEVFILSALRHPVGNTVPEMWEAR